jgi:hypothetical protein
MLVVTGNKYATESKKIRFRRIETWILISKTAGHFGNKLINTLIELEIEK